MKLTIAIPTYNRNEILKENLELLLPQVSTDCRLLILDNCSDVPVKQTIAELVDRYSNIDIQVIRNPYNVGMTANILKCFELCTDSWLWILGDDDQVKDGAVGKILSDTRECSEFHCISYAWDEMSLQRRKIATKGVGNFIDSFENVGVVLFLSTSVYNIKKVSKGISYGNFFQSTYAPHLVVLFMSLGEQGECLLSDEQVVVNTGYDTPSELRWDQIFIYQITLLLRLPLRPRVLSKLKKQLTQLTRVWTITHFIYVLVNSEYDKNNRERYTMLYGEVVRSFYHLDRRIISRIMVLIGHVLIRFPFIFKRPLNYIYKLAKGREFFSENNFRI